MDWVGLVGRIPWDKLVRDLMSGGLGACDPSFVFDWPLARVLAVFFAAEATGATELTTAEVYERVNRRRAEKGLPPIQPKG